MLAPANTKELIFQFVGIMNKKEPLTDGEQNIVLEENDLALSEVVVGQ